MEDEAFRSAGELLMPAAQIRSLLGNLTLPRLAALKLVWRVSMAALISHAAQNSSISRNQARYLWMQIGRAGYRQREPTELDFPKETAGLLQELFDLYRQSFGYSLLDLGTWFALYEHELLALYPLTPLPQEARHHLRAIRN